MDSLVQLIKTIALFVTALLLIWFELAPVARAVIPPPDGGYPNFNTAEGQKALFSLTSGAGNTAVGWFSLKSATTGSFNTGVGAGTLALNTGDENTAIGTAALLLNTASGNTAVGSRALLNNTVGGTLQSVQGADLGPNVAVGQQALESNTVAGANTAVGYQALHDFTAGPAGLEQVGLCTAVGFQALAKANGAGVTNSGFGYRALGKDTVGSANTAIGLNALFNNTTGSRNVAVGNNSLFGSNGANNTAIGFNSGASVTTANNVICIGSNVLGENASDTCYIGNIFNVTSTNGLGVFVNANGKLGTSTSSYRFKEAIEPMENFSEALFALKPVRFRYNKEIDPASASQLGLVAEDVEKVNPDLIVRDKEGRPYGVRYDQVNAMLLNEFLKEHKAFVEEQRKAQEHGAKIARLEQEMEALTESLQKVSAQLAAASPSLADLK